MRKTTGKQPKVSEAKRDIGAELLQAALQIRSGKATRLHRINVPTIVEARIRVGLSRRRFAAMLGVSSATMACWETGKHTPARAGRLEQVLANMCRLVMQFFGGDAVKTAFWFKTRNFSLGDISPRDMIRYGRYEKLHRFVMDSLQNNATPPTTQAGRAHAKSTEKFPNKCSNPA
jgi:putative transcriptional regulator